MDGEPFVDDYISTSEQVCSLYFNGPIQASHISHLTMVWHPTLPFAL